MYNNNIVNFQESTTILNAYTKKSWGTYWMHHVSYRGGCPGVYLFDEVSFADLGFEKLSRLSEILFSFSFYISVCLMVSAFKYFSFSFFASVLMFFSDLVVLFLPLFLFYNNSLQARNIFQCQIPFLYHGFIFFVSGFPLLFHCWQVPWYHLYTWGGLSFPVIS